MKITGHTELIGLIATPIRHSKSPEMHNAAFQALDLDYVYLVFEVGQEGLETAVKGLREMGVRGWNVSMPNKTSIIPYLDEISEASKLCGAVNTVINNDGYLVGTITDGIGWHQSLNEKGIHIKDRNMVLLGAGGAATAILVEAAMSGVNHIDVFEQPGSFFERGKEKTQFVSEKTGVPIEIHDVHDTDLLHEKLQDATLLVNATSVGMAPNTDASLVREEDLHKDLIVMDCVYNPLETKLLSLAKKKGCTVSSGLGMMLYQGAASFKMWTGEDMPIDVVKEALGFNE